MKNAKRISALLFAAMMAASLASCGSSSTGSTESTASTGTNTAASDNSGDSSAADSTAATDEVTLPLCEEKTTLTFFQTTDQNAAIMQTDYNDLQFYQELEERTNVHIEWWQNSSADFQTNFNLMIASNNLPDIIFGADYYSDGLDAACDDGYFLDLTDLIPQYAPHYDAVRNSSDLYRVSTMTDSGRVIAMYQLQQSLQGPWDGVEIRKDWLDDLGLDTPVTYDDWTTVLTAFKDEKGAYAPLYICGNGVLDLSSAFMSGFDVTYTWQLTEDGTVGYGPYQEGWKEYIQQMHDWYAAGLIDPDFMATNQYFGDMTMIITGKTGAWTSMYTMMSLYENSTEDENMDVVAISAPRKTADQQLHLRLADQYYSGNPTAISANCSNPELALKWFDYLFTDEGALLANYGVENDTFTYASDGSIQWTDKVLNNAEYSFAQAQVCYCAPPSAMPYYYDWTRELPGVSEEDANALNVWSEGNDADWVMPKSLTLTADESIERAALMADIDTYWKEQTTQMITGTVDIESNWDTYISTIQGMGIDRATEITQAAYDRYLNR